MIRIAWNAEIQQFRATNYSVNDRALRVGLRNGSPSSRQSVANLTESQVKKLEVAGKGDIKHFNERLENFTRRFDEPIVDLNELQRACVSEWNRLQADWNAGLFGEGSLLEKTLVATLTPEQAALRTAILRTPDAGATSGRSRLRSSDCSEISVSTIGRASDWRSDPDRVAPSQAIWPAI